jgi:hypothetical protein
MLIPSDLVRTTEFYRRKLNSMDWPEPDYIVTFDTFSARIEDFILKPQSSRLLSDSLSRQCSDTASNDTASGFIPGNEKRCWAGGIAALTREYHVLATIPHAYFQYDLDDAYPKKLVYIYFTEYTL